MKTQRQGLGAVDEIGTIQRRLDKTPDYDYDYQPGSKAQSQNGSRFK
jgi:hypothetical protein